MFADLNHELEGGASFVDIDNL